MSRQTLLTAEEHRGMRIVTEPAAERGDAVMACMTVPDEFRQVQADFPILFRFSPERDSVSALALFGFQEGENLFLEGDRWDAGYRPLALAIQPFLIGRPAEGQTAKQVHVDLASPRIGGAEGTRVFDDDGRPTPYLEAIADRLGDLDAGYEASAAFYDALRRYELLEPFTLQVTLDDGSTNRLVGFHIIDEERLRGLDAAALGALHAEGHLMAIFMALASLGKLTDLIARKNRRMADG